MAHAGFVPKSCTLCLWEGVSLWPMEAITPPAPHEEERQRVLGVMGPLQGAAASPILTRTKYKTVYGVEVSPWVQGQSLEQTTAQSSKLQKTAPSGAKASKFSTF